LSRNNIWFLKDGTDATVPDFSSQIKYSEVDTMQVNTTIITKLLELLEQHYNDGIYRDIVLFTEIHNKSDMSIYTLVIRGERDINTPLYCGSAITHISKEDYCDGELVYASLLHKTRKVVL
jgi:hypothetical protein